MTEECSGQMQHRQLRADHSVIDDLGGTGGVVASVPSEIVGFQTMYLILKV